MLTNSSTEVVTQSLLELGLEKTHTEVYIAALELGNSSASQIAKQAKIPRTTVYYLLDELVQKGLITEVERETKKEYSVTEPNNLRQAIKERLDSVQEISYNLEQNLFQLEALFESHQPRFPKVRFFEGERGIKTVLYDTLTSSEFMTICQGSTEYQTGLDSEPKYLMEFIEETKRRGIKIRELLMDTPSTREYTNKYKGGTFDMVLIPNTLDDKKFGHVDKHIYDGKVSFVTHDNKTGVIIEDEAIFLNEKAQFEKLWEVYSKNRNYKKLGRSQEIKPTTDSQ